MPSNDSFKRRTFSDPGPVNILRTPRAPGLPHLVELRVARISHGSLLHRDAMEQFDGLLRSIADEANVLEGK